MVVSPTGGPPESFVHGFSTGFAERLKTLYRRGYRLSAPIKGSTEIRSDHILWPELAMEGISLFSAWPLSTAGRTVGELHVGVLDPSAEVALPPDEFMETFAGALALVIDRNSLLSSHDRLQEKYQWHLKLVESLVNGDEDAVCVTDDLGRVLMLNPAGESLLKIPESTVVGRRLNDVDRRFSAVGESKETLGTEDQRISFVGGDDASSAVEGIRFSRFLHNGRRYFAWRLREVSTLQSAVVLESSANALMQHERLAVFSCDSEGIIVSGSVNLTRILGAGAAESLIGNSVQSAAVLRVSGIAKVVLGCMKTGVSQVSSHEIFHRTRGTVYLTVHCTPIFQEKSVLAGVQAVIEDATDIVRTRTSLMQSEERYRIFFNNAPIALIEIDLSGLSTQEGKVDTEPEGVAFTRLVRVSAVNPAAAEMYGAASSGDLKEFWVSLHRSAPELLRKMTAALLKGNISAQFETSCTTLTGEALVVSIHAAVAPGHEQTLSRVMLSIVDITQIKSMEQALRTQLALERLVSRISARFVSLEPDKTSEGIAGAVEEIGLVLDLDTVALFEPNGTVGLVARYIWTAGAEGNLPIGISSLLSADFPLFADAIRAFQVVRMDAPSDLPANCNERQMAASLGISALLMIPLAARGKLRGVLALASKTENRWCDENVALLRIMADVAADALDREQRESARRESEDLLRTVFQSMVGGLLVTNPEGVVLLANPSAASSFKLSSAAELIGKPLGEVVKGAGGMLRASPPGEQQQILLTLSDGSRNTFGFTNASAVSGRRIILFRDLSPMIEIARRQKRAEELARLGMMTAKLSHEIKNPLASMLLGLRSLEESAGLNEEDLSVLRSVLEEVRFLKSFVGNFLDTTRFQDVVPVLRPVAPILQSVWDAQSRQAKRRGVILRLQDETPAFTLCIDSNAMIRALGNLVTNAVEACAEKDTVSLGCRLLSKPEVDARFNGFEGDIVCLYVEDTGPGLPSEVLDNLFVPFTTTKSFGNGLGLSIVRETVTGHGGVIEVVTPTRAGGGTRMEILLPSGRRLSCLEVHSETGGCLGCPVPEGCPVREAEGYFSCWVIKGKASLAETGKWNEECVGCPAFLEGNLEHFYVRPDSGSVLK